MEYSTHNGPMTEEERWNGDDVHVKVQHNKKEWREGKKISELNKEFVTIPPH